MDYLIFYKKGVDLQRQISKIRFSYTRAYTLAFASEAKDLVKHLNQFNEALLFYFTDELSQGDKISIANIKKRFDSVQVCLCSNEVFALDAWKMHLFHFIDQPVSNLNLEDGYKKYIASIGGLDQELKIKTKDGLVRIPFRMINYLRANGNYTQIALKGGRTITETKQLQHYDYFTERDLNMKRLHRSFIFNMRNIKSVGNQILQFYKTDKVLNLSKALEKKLRQTLLST